MPDDTPKLIKANTVSTKWGAFNLFTDVDGLGAFLSCGFIAKEIGFSDISQVVDELGICNGVIQEALLEVVELAQADKPMELLKIAQGTPVVEGHDAYVEFHKRTAGQAVEMDASVEEKIDYRELNVFENVRKGDHIATFVPMVEGQGGADVYDKVILPGKIKDLRVDAGENVIYKEDERKFFATNDGYIVYEKGRIAVSTVYHVKGNVDLSHGNIRFIGRVEIDRDVPDEYEIEAAEGIVIGGTAEACRLKSTKEITVHGGFTGKGKGVVECQGDFVARYINEAVVYCGSDVIIEKEIVNSKVYAMGRVVLTRGTIIGSEVVALKGILTQDAGSDLGVKTNLVAGLDYHFHERIVGINKELVKAELKQQELLNKTGPMIEQAMKSPAVDTRVRDHISELMRTIRGLQRTIDRLTVESGEIARGFMDEAIEVVTIIRNCYPGVLATLGKFEYASKHHVTGPMSFIPDEEKFSVRIENGNLVEKMWQDGSSPEDCPPVDEKESGSNESAEGGSGEEGADG